jgi:chromosomal replication initiator protein
MAHSQLVGWPITLETTQEVLYDLRRANDRRVTIERDPKRVAEHFNIVSTYSARSQVPWPGCQVAMIWLAAHPAFPAGNCPKSGRDHTRSAHAVRKVEELRSADLSFAGMELLRRMPQS